VWARRAESEGPLQLDIIVPVLMSCALLWWVSRGMTWTTRLTVAAVTLVLIFCILLFERSSH
jgi:membrane protein CcdC involved in cytochrome C biogenesis